MIKTFENFTNNFEDNYEKLWGKMLKVCMLYTKGDVDMAKDYCQDGFIKAFNNIEKFDGNGNFEGWVRRVIVNNILDDIRKKKETKDTNIDISKLDSPDDEYFEFPLSIDDIKNVLPKLPPSYRKAIELYYLQNMKHHEIAKLLGISVSTSKTNLLRAKDRIRSLLS